MILMAAFAGVVCFVFLEVDLVQDTEQMNAFSACYDAKSGAVFIVITGRWRYDFASFRMEGGDTKSGKL